MDPIGVPKPKGIRDPNRPAGTLLLAQVHHLHEAEKSLPPKYHSRIFFKAIVTEDDAARYIQAVTKAIHTAHDDAVRERGRGAAQRKRDIGTTVAADKGTSRKRPGGGKKNKGKRPRARRPAGGYARLSLQEA